MYFSITAVCGERWKKLKKSCYLENEQRMNWQNAEVRCLSSLLAKCLLLQYKCSQLLQQKYGYDKWQHILFDSIRTSKSDLFIYLPDLNLFLASVGNSTTVTFVGPLPLCYSITSNYC